jgi:DsbC/DsbD-like thiol-disulfide interchange protein
MRVHLMAVMCALAVTAAPGAAPAPVAWTLLGPAEPADARPGDRLEVTARATVERGWYLYAMNQPPGGPTPLRISVPEGQPFALAGPVTGPEPKRGWDTAFEIDTARHDGTVAFTVPLQIAASAEEGKTTLQVQVRFQACSDTLCLRPKTETLSLPIEIRAARTDARARHARESR